MEHASWLSENSDGSMTIKFDDRPLKIDGAEVKSINMREPTVQDQLTASQGTTGAADAEITLIANLCEQAPDTIKAITSRQYRRLQAALQVFMD